MKRLLTKCPWKLFRCCLSSCFVLVLSSDKEYCARNSLWQGYEFPLLTTVVAAYSTERTLIQLAVTASSDDKENGISSDICYNFWAPMAPTSNTCFHHRAWTSVWSCGWRACWWGRERLSFRSDGPRFVLSRNQVLSRGGKIHLLFYLHARAAHFIMRHLRLLKLPIFPYCAIFHCC